MHGSGQAQRFDQAAWTGFSGAGNAERRAMIGRGTDEGQPERHVHTLLEGECLERHQRLVVIHANGGVVGRAGAGMEQSVGGMRPGDVESLGPRRFDRRGDDVDLLAAEPAVFAGMRVEAGDGKPGALDAEITAKIAGRDLDAW